MKILNNAIVMDIVPWGKKKCIYTTILCLVTGLLLLCSLPKHSENLLILTWYSFIICFDLFMIGCVLYAKLIALKKFEKKFEQYKKIWEDEFEDGSFDRYFKFKDVFSNYFEASFFLQLRLRILDNLKYDEDEEEKYNYSRTVNRKQVEALSYFGYYSLSDVTMEGLKRKYKEILKKIHPDNGGSQQKTEELIDYYNCVKELI